MKTTKHFIVAGLLLLQIIAMAQPVELTIQSSHGIMSYAFTKDYKFLVTGGNDYTVKLWDVNTGLLIRTMRGHEGYVSFVGFTEDEKKIVSYGGTDKVDDGSHSINVWDIETGEQLFSIPFDITFFAYVIGNEYLFAGNRTTVKVIDLVNGEIAFEVESRSTYLDPNRKYFLTCAAKKKPHYLYSINDKEPLLKIKEYSEFFRAYIIDNIFYYRVDYPSTAKAFDLKNRNELKGKHGYNRNYGEGEFLDIKREGEWDLYDKKQKKQAITIPGRGKHEVIKSYGSLNILQNNKLARTFTGFFNNDIFLNVNQDETHFISNSTNKYLLWSMKYCKVIGTFPGKTTGNYLYPKGELSKFNPDGNSFFTCLDGNIHFWDTKSQKHIKMLNTGLKAIDLSNVYYCPDGKKLAVLSCTSNKKPTIYDVNKLENKIELNESSPINERDGSIIKYRRSVGSFSPDGKYFVCGESVCDINNLENNKLEQSLHFITLGAQNILFSPDRNNLIIARRFGGIENIKIKSEKKIENLSEYKNIYAVKFIAEDQLAIGTKTGISVVEYPSAKLLKEYNYHSSDVMDFSFLKDNRVMTSSRDGTVKLYDTEKKETIVTFIAIREEDYAIVTPDHYYTASKNAHKGLHFTQGTNVFTFEQFDLRYNRPDIVAQRIGKTPEKLIQAYYAAYLKRLNKMGFTEDQVKEGGLNYPELIVQKDSLPYQTNSKSIDISFKAFDEKYNLQRINLYINDVPVYGVKGKALKEDISSIEKTLKIELSPGLNKIQLSVHNEVGVESYKETIMIECNAKFDKPNLYVVAIGVSNFADNQYNLTYAAKDANDICKTFKQNSNFSKTTVLEITNANSTKENILKAKQTLMDSKVEDMVVLFVASHGLLSDNMDYYIASHNVDFNNPASKGILYDELENLLDGIPARKKIMLIDACHSGEVDKDEMVLADVEMLGGEVKSRGFKSVKKKENQLGTQNSFELMKELFADLRRGTGAIVISSASGAEFAFESSEWKNGVFTYALLEGLKTGKADIDKNKEIVVSELRNYVFDRVKELTNGKQNPTSRRENLEFDFRVW